MIISIDYDGTIVEQGSYDLRPSVFRPGAVEGLWRLRAAGHKLLLFSARANRVLRFGDQWDPLLRGQGGGWLDQTDLHRARYQQMVDFVGRELPGVFDAVDEGLQGKPVCDLFIDDRAWGASVDWLAIASELGAADWLPDLSYQVRVITEGSPYGAALQSLRAIPNLRRSIDPRWRGDAQPAAYPIGWTQVGPMVAVDFLPDPPGHLTDTVQRVAVIAGQHGEEQVGVAALCSRWQLLWGLAVKRRLHLRVYPCVNPEGFDRGQRYNYRGQSPTNAALEYEVAPSEWRGEVSTGQTWRATRNCARASDESRWLVNDLGKFRPHYVLDLHQDSMTPPGGAFAYVFGERAPYAKIMEQSGAKPMAHTLLQNESWTEAAPNLSTDGDGLASFQDGSVTAWAWLRGAKLAACLEVPTKGRFEDQVAITLGWVEAFLDAASMRETART